MYKDKLERGILVGLLILTALIYLLQRYSLDHILVFDAQTSFPIKAISDNSTLHGKSITSISIVDNKIILDCEIIASDYAWPFCEITFKLHDENIPEQRYGINLSNYETVAIYATYQNIHPLGIRFQIRNYHNAYSQLQDVESWKYTGIEYFSLEDSPLIIPIKALQVATWWLLERKIPIAESAPELKNVMVLELATGNNIKPGKYQIVLEKIIFQGKRFSTEQVYSAIILLWVSASLFLFFYHLALSRSKLRKAHKKTLDLKRLNKLLNVQTQELKDQAERDPLTGALNRSGIKAIFIQDLPQLSIAFIDIDHFKQVNDIHGHAVGDDVLRKFSALLSENSRDTDFLARWGGEEFLLVCPNTTLAKTRTLAEALRELIENYQWPNDIKLTSSFGIAQRRKESNTKFIARADKALYSAKAQGRNRVVSSK